MSLYDKIVNPVIVRRLSSELIAQDPRCTWNFLRDFNYEKMSEVYHISSKISNIAIHTNDKSENFHFKKLNLIITILMLIVIYLLMLRVNQNQPMSSFSLNLQRMNNLVKNFN